MIIVPASQNNFSAALHLLRSNNLPTEDISEVIHLFVIENNSGITGTVGIEFSAGKGLLRSLAVSAENRHLGYGKYLVSFIEGFARQQGVRELFLLTTTADKFFAASQYCTISRNEIPDFIKSSTEYKICPASAIIMKKELKD